MRASEPEIPGWTDFADLYAAWARRLPEDAQVVEVGSYLGKSALCWGRETRLAGKRTRLTCYDTFTGVPEELIHDAGYRAHQRTWLRDNGGTLRPVFDRHVAPLGDQIEAHTVDSLTASTRHAPETLDALFLDDDHSYEHVKAELAAWWPALKPGGWLAGHDFDWPTVKLAVLEFAAAHQLTVLEVSQRSWQLRKPGPLTWTVPPPARKALVAVCSNERTIFRQTAESLVRLGWGGRLIKAMRAADFVDIQFTWVHSSPRVDALRDQTLLLAAKQHCSHVVFLDADMTWPETVLADLLPHHDQGIVSGHYRLKGWPHHPVAFHDRRWNTREQIWDYVYDLDALGATGLRRELLVGMGCCLVPTVLAYVLPRPWFRYQRSAATGMPSVTEDVAFCEAATEIGCPIWLDPTIVCHHGNVDFVGETHAARATFDLQWLEKGEAPPLPHELVLEEKEATVS